MSDEKTTNGKTQPAVPASKAPEAPAGSIRAAAAEIPVTAAQTAVPVKKPAGQTPSQKAGAAKKTALKATKKAASRKPAPRKAAKRTARKTAKTASRTAATEIRAAQAAHNVVTRQSTQIMENIMTQGKTQFDKLAQDAAKSGKEQVDALIESGNVFFKGLENIVKTYLSLAQTSAEKNSQAAKNLLGCRTINEFTEAQNKWAQQNFDDFMEGTTKLSELSVKVATDAFEPINDQVSKSIKKASESLAA